MNIEIARQYTDIDFTDDELVFVGLMTALGEYSGFDTQYTFCANDIMRIFGRPGLKPHCEYLEKMRTVFRIGYINDYNWTVKWIDTKNSFYNRKYKDYLATAQTDTKVLTEIDAKLNWAFLMGKLTNMEHNVRDWTEHSPNVQGEHSDDPKIIKSNLKGWYPTRRF